MNGKQLQTFLTKEWIMDFTYTYYAYKMVVLYNKYFKHELKCYLQTYLQELASHSPLGLNLTEETAFVCPANVNFNV